VNWMHVVQDKDQWQTFVNTVSFIFNKKWEIFDHLSDY
jgi:hypothetical protein